MRQHISSEHKGMHIKGLEVGIVKTSDIAKTSVKIAWAGNNGRMRSRPQKWTTERWSTIYKIQMKPLSFSMQPQHNLLHEPYPFLIPAGQISLTFWISCSVLRSVRKTYSVQMFKAHQVILQDVLSSDRDCKVHLRKHCSIQLGSE